LQHFSTEDKFLTHFAKPRNCTKGSFTLFKLSKLFTTSRNVQQNPIWYTQKVHQMVLALFKYFRVFRHHYCFQKFCTIRLPQEIYNQQNPIGQPKNLHQEVFYTFQIFKIFRHLKKFSVSKPTKCTKWSLDCSNLQSFSPPLVLPKDFSPEATTNRATQFSKAKKLYNMIFHISKCSKVCTSKNFARFFSKGHLKKFSLEEPNLANQKIAPNGPCTVQISKAFRHHDCFQKFCKILPQRPPREIFNRQNPI
jgi:hypothetical protein